MPIWRVEFSDSARKELRKLSHQAQSEILDYLRDRIATQENPRRFGKALRSNFSGLWRYRVRDYRIVCRIEEEQITVLVLRVAHRREVYD